MSAAQLALRDVHLSATPSWWPLAPGWWMVIAAAVVLLAIPAFFYWRRARRQRRWMAMFDAALAAMDTPASRLAAASGMLRRAARRVDPDAASLQGEEWLRFLDGAKRHDFSKGEGHLLLDGGYRRSVEEHSAAAVCALARARFLELMAGRK